MAGLVPPSDHKKLEDLDLTEEEVDRFQKAFQDEKFKEMFLEYAKEISDPKNRAESEAYLRQIEGEGKSEQVYGKGVTLVVPNPGFAVKTRAVDGGGKVFVNIVYSEKVADATSVKMEGGAQWSVPFSIGNQHKESDKGGAECVAYDFCVGDGTYRMAESNARFKGLVVDTALDALENQREVKVDRSYTLPKLKFKGPAEGPGVQAVKDAKDNPGIKPEHAVGEDEEGEAPAAVETEGGLLKPVGEPQVDGVTGKGKPAPKPSPFSFDRAVQRKKKAPPAAPATNDKGEKVPKHTVVHRGEYDSASGWQDARVHDTQRIPKELLLRVELPDLDGIAGVDLDVSSRHVLVHKPGEYCLDLPLPHEVDDGKGRAKWDKGRRVLEVTLPVVQPKVEPKRFVEPAPEPEEDLTEEAPEAKTPVERAPAPPAEEAAGKVAELALDERQPPPPPQQQPPAMDKEEMKRKWEEWKAGADARRAAEAGDAAPAPAAGGGGGSAEDTLALMDEEEDDADERPEFVEAKAFEGAKEGYYFGLCLPHGLGYHRDPGAKRQLAFKRKPAPKPTPAPAPAPALPPAQPTAPAEEPAAQAPPKSAEASEFADIVASIDKEDGEKPMTVMMAPSFTDMDHILDELD